MKYSGTRQVAKHRWHLSALIQASSISRYLKSEMNPGNQLPERIQLQRKYFLWILFVIYRDDDMGKIQAGHEMCQCQVHCVIKSPASGLHLSGTLSGSTISPWNSCSCRITN